MGNTLRNRFPGTESKQQIVLTAFLRDMEHVELRTSLNFIKTSQKFFDALTALNARFAYSWHNSHHLQSNSLE